MSSPSRRRHRRGAPGMADALLPAMGGRSVSPCRSDRAEGDPPRETGTTTVARPRTTHAGRGHRAGPVDVRMARRRRHNPDLRSGICWYPGHCALWASLLSLPGRHLPLRGQRGGRYGHRTTQDRGNAGQRSHELGIEALDRGVAVRGLRRELRSPSLATDHERRNGPRDVVRQLRVA